MSAQRNIVGIVGSLRSGSLNLALMKAAAERAPASMVVEVRTLHGIPVYDGDAEVEHGIPSPVADLKEAIAAADGILVATPEYNSGMPGVLKNAIDWCTRPPKDIARVFGGKPLGLFGATPGGWGTKLAQAAWLPVFRSLDVVPWLGGQLYVAKASGMFEDGRLTDETIGERLEKFMAGFDAFVEQHGRH